MMKKFFVLILLSLILLSCKKKDTISSQTIRGQVYNLCTDSGMANITVYLSTSGAALNPATTLSTISDANGNFSFNNAQIHSSSEYEYSLYIPSKSGIGEAGLTGDGKYIDKSNSYKKYRLSVIPTFNILTINVNPIVTFIFPDTVTLTFTQKTYHKFVSNYPYQLIATSYGLKPGYPDSSKTHFDYFPMGLWNITIDKTKAGIRTLTNDSIYIDYGSSKTYTFSF